MDKLRIKKSYLQTSFKFFSASAFSLAERGEFRWKEMGLFGMKNIDWSYFLRKNVKTYMDNHSFLLSLPR